MENKPEYRIRVIIEDVNVGEEVCQESDMLYSMDEDTVKVAFRALEHFRRLYQQKHEETHYERETDSEGSVGV